MQAYNKAIAAAAVTVGVWLASLGGLEVPSEVQGALATLLVFFVPNRPAG